MRISILKDDPDFTPTAKEYLVSIDGRKQDSCIIADSNKGLIIRYKKTKLGTYCVARNGKFITETLHGNVLIERRN